MRESIKINRLTFTFEPTGIEHDATRMLEVYQDEADFSTILNAEEVAELLHWLDSKRTRILAMAHHDEDEEGEEGQ